MLCIFILVLVTEIKLVVCTPLEFSVKENAKIGTVVGNIYNKLSTFLNTTKIELIKNDYSRDSYFTFEKETGNLVVRSLIDREDICEDSKEDDCTITLLADREADVLQMIIKIEDVNDNSPTFLSAQKIIHIQENILSGMTYFLPVAQDRDTTNYGVNNYSISNFRTVDSKHNEHFSKNDKFFRIEGSISPQLQIIGKIDREEIVSFIFVLVASDFGHRTGSCTVSVVVTDINDNSPEWKKDNYKVKIKECQQHGEIFEFDATDKDDPNTPNGRVSYRFSDRTKDRDKISQIFYINDNKLYLSNNRPSELSNTGFITMFIIAADGNGRMKETSIQIIIEDCNDHPPIISINKRYGYILENIKEKHSLSIVTVKDNDRGRNGLFECALNDSSILNLVKRHIDLSQNLIVYKIETNGDYAFDRENIAVYTVEIKCVDQGDPSLSSTQRFSINILDENDNAPKFNDNALIFHITENNAIGSTVGHVRALDPDSGVNGHIRYSIASENDFFTIGIYGEIQSKVKFDREDRDNYEFSLVATDGGNPPLNDTIIIKVFIIDMNDCLPIFKDEYLFKITESFGETRKSERVGIVKATDKDFGVNGTVNYKLLNIKCGGVNGLTMLKPQLQQLIRVSSDGEISIYGILDREKISSIQVIVEAYDNGDPRLSAQTTVLIEILDINDNSPKFIFPNKFQKYLNICLDFNMGTHVGSVAATDPDNGINGTIQYKVIGEQNKFFSLFKLELDGKIIVTSDLAEFPKNQRLPDRFTIQASDLGNPPRSSITKLFLRYYDSRIDLLNQNLARKSTESSRENSLGKPQIRNKSNKDNSFSNATVSDGMMLLYCLAAILFIVFIIVFSVLLYVYCSKSESISERYSTKLHKSNNSPINSNSKELHQMKVNVEDFHECHSGKNEAVSFMNDYGSSYTNLMTLNNSKYTPMIHSSMVPNNLQCQENLNQPEARFISPNIDSSSFQSTSPQMSKASIKKFSFSNNTNLTMGNCTQNYSTLQNIHSNTSVNMNPNINSLCKGNNPYALEGSDVCQQQKDFNSQYVTSSFV